MITKRIEFGQIAILPDGQIQLRQDTIIEEDGVEIIRTFNRSVLAPGDDTSKVIDDRISAITSAIWTPDVIKKHQDKVNSFGPPNIFKK